METVMHPEDAHGFQKTGPFHASRVHHAPAEALADAGHHLLGRGVVAADEHVGRAARELRVHHVGAAHGVEGLHHLGVGQPALHLFAAGIRIAEGELEKRKVAEVGDAGDRDEGDRARLGRDDRD